MKYEKDHTDKKNTDEIRRQRKVTDVSQLEAEQDILVKGAETLSNALNAYEKEYNLKKDKMDEDHKQRRIVFEDGNPDEKVMGLKEREKIDKEATK